VDLYLNTLREYGLGAGLHSPIASILLAAVTMCQRAMPYRRTATARRLWAITDCVPTAACCSSIRN